MFVVDARDTSRFICQQLLQKCEICMTLLNHINPSISICYEREVK